MNEDFVVPALPNQDETFTESRVISLGFRERRACALFFFAGCGCCLIRGRPTLFVGMSRVSLGFTKPRKHYDDTSTLVIGILGFGDPFVKKTSPEEGFAKENQGRA